jgi:hypothetical protein
MATAQVFMQQRQRAAPPLDARVAAVDWQRIGAELDRYGHALTGPLLTPEECAALAAGYVAEALFRARVVMTRHGFGQGEYKYFAYPLPEPVAILRKALYQKLAPLANRWEAVLAGTCAIQRITMPISHVATQPAKRGLRPCCSGMGRTTTTACTRTCMARCIFPCRLPSC